MNEWILIYSNQFLDSTPSPYGGQMYGSPMYGATTAVSPQYGLTMEPQPRDMTYTLQFQQTVQQVSKHF